MVLHRAVRDGTATKFCLHSHGHPCMPPDSEHHELPVYPSTTESMSGAIDIEPLLGEEQDLGATIQIPRQVPSVWRLRASFFLFGTINNSEKLLVPSCL